MWYNTKFSEGLTASIFKVLAWYNDEAEYENLGGLCCLQLQVYDTE